MFTMRPRGAAVAGSTRIAVLIGVLCGVGACKRKPTSATGGPAIDPASGSAAAADQVTADQGTTTTGIVPAVPDWRIAVLPVNAPAEFAAWDMPGRAQAWQGVWLSQPGLGFFLAIEVVGTRVTSWDGSVEKTMEFALESPCSAKFIENSSAGQSSSTTHFTVKAGKLLAGLGDAGSRKGNAAIVCASNVILVLDDTGTCTQYTPSFGNYNRAVGKCALRTQAGVEVFAARVNGVDLELLVDGDVIYSAQLGNMPDRSFADFAAAKAARP